MNTATHFYRRRRACSPLPPSVPISTLSLARISGQDGADESGVYAQCVIASAPMGRGISRGSCSLTTGESLPGPVSRIRRMIRHPLPSRRSASARPLRNLFYNSPIWGSGPGDCVPSTATWLAGCAVTSPARRPATPSYGLNESHGGHPPPAEPRRPTRQAAGRLRHRSIILGCSAADGSSPRDHAVAVQTN
jgi:hypothetical protein